MFYFGRVVHELNRNDDTIDELVPLDGFKGVVGAMSIALSETELADAFGNMEPNSDGSVTIDDICVWYKDFKESGTKGAGAPQCSTTTTFDALEVEIMQVCKDPAMCDELWDLLDFDGNNIVSLAEIDKLMVQRYPPLNHKPALMRAYKQTCLKEGGDGDAWVEPNEFPMLLANLFYFNKLFQCFDQVDTDDDRRLDEKEFLESLSRLSLDLSEDEAKAEFDAMDSNDGGIVLFDEFCIWYTKKVNPTRDIADCTDQLIDNKKKKKKKKKKKGPTDAMPDYSSKKCDKLEVEVTATVTNPEKLNKTWDIADFHDNQAVSLAKIDKLMVQSY